MSGTWDNLDNPNFVSSKTGDINGGNYTEVEQDGTLVFKGDATVWNDLVGSLIGRRLSSTAGRVDYNYNENSITMQNAGSISSINDRLIFNYEYPHECIIDGEMRLHMHWEQVNSNQIEFTVQYRIQDNGVAKTTSWTTSNSNSTDDSIYTYTSGTLNQITNLATIDLTGVGISSTVQFRLARVDSTVGNIEATFVDAHVESNNVGSREPFNK